MSGRAWLGVTAGILCWAMAACGPAVTTENYELITQGMSLQEVENILGEGELQTASGVGIGSSGMMERSSDATSDRQTYLWQDDRKQIVVVIKGGKVQSKSKTGF